MNQPRSARFPWSSKWAFYQQQSAVPQYQPFNQLRPKTSYFGQFNPEQQRNERKQWNTMYGTDPASKT